MDTSVRDRVTAIEKEIMKKPTTVIDAIRGYTAFGSLPSYVMEDLHMQQECMDISALEFWTDLMYTREKKRKGTIHSVIFCKLSHQKRIREKWELSNMYNKLDEYVNGGLITTEEYDKIHDCLGYSANEYKTLKDHMERIKTRLRNRRDGLLCLTFGNIPAFPLKDDKGHYLPADIIDCIVDYL